MSVPPSRSSEERATLLAVVIALSLEFAIEPASIALVMPEAFTLSASELISIELSSTATLRVLPLFVKAEPAVISPAPLNCVNDNEVVPKVIAPSVVNTNPASAFVVPSSTNTYAPLATSAFASKSTARVGAPEALTV